MLNCTSDAVAVAKKKQNLYFKVSGALGLLLGTLGFAPSWYKGLTDCLWSVSHNAPHTENDFLGLHAIFMAIWFVAVAIQLSTGGTRFRRSHVLFGYVGFTGLLFGMVTATANMLKYDRSDVKRMSAGLYTFILVLAGSSCALMGIARARQRRFSEHKDFMLMTIMYTLDPALQRLVMWMVHVAAGPTQYLDPDALLICTKMPTNILCIATFGIMAVRGNRVNGVTFCNLGVICLLFMSVVCFLILSGEGHADSVIWYSLLVAVMLMLSIIFALILLHRKCAPQCSLLSSSGVSSSIASRRG